MSHFLTDMEMLSKIDVSQETSSMDIKSKSGNSEGEGIPNNLKSLLRQIKLVVLILLLFCFIWICLNYMTFFHIFIYIIK